MTRMKLLFVILGSVFFLLTLNQQSLACSCSKSCSKGSCQEGPQGCACNEKKVATTDPSANVQNSAQAGNDEQAAKKEPVNAGNKICPVSGMQIGGEGGMAPATYEYEGKIYNFCCAGCIAEFKKDPQKYMKKVEEELKQGAK